MMEINNMDQSNTIHSPRTRTRRPSYTCKEPGCGRSFLRQEHLQRHRLNHEPEEIFSCDMCPKSFVRRDLYRRHKSRHEKGMFFRNTGGVVHPPQSSSSSKRNLENPGQSTMRESLQNEHLHDDDILVHDSIDDETVNQQVGSFQNADDIGMDPMWTGWLQPQNVQDDLDWFFEPIHGISDLPTPPMAVDATLPNINFELPGVWQSENQAMGMGSIMEAGKIEDIPGHNQYEEWLNARFNITDAMNQLDERILQSAFFDIDNLKMFYELYFKNYHPHFPIFHLPTFSVIGCEPLLLIAILDLGSTMAVDDTLFELGQQIHESLRLIILNSGMFEPPIPLWCLQALLLVQAYGKMISSRKNYEMAHIFHGAILTMMKRGSIYLAASTSRTTRTIESLQQGWYQWINEESWRRTAFFAFCMDAQHACVFGHSPVLSVSDMRMALPCQESLWECTSPETWQELVRLEANSNNNTAFFLPTLKAMLRGKLVPSACSEYARFLLLHGLMSLQMHLHAGSRLTLGIEAGKLHSKEPPVDAGDNNFPANDTAQQPWVNIMSSAISSWSTCLLSLQPSLCLEAARPLHRMAQITLHVSVVDVHTLAMNPDRLDSSLARSSYDKARARIQRWCSTDSAHEAVRYSLLLVQETMFSGHRYRARDDNIAPRPWCLYIAVLTLWVYGVITEGPIQFQDDGGKAGAEDYVIRMTSALQRGLTGPVGANQTVGLIRAVRNALIDCRWELLQEAYQVLGRLSGECVHESGSGQNKTLI